MEKSPLRHIIKVLVTVETEQSFEHVKWLLENTMKDTAVSVVDVEEDN